MRLARLLGSVSIVFVSAGCAETPRCEDRGTAERPRIVLECNAGKVPVCGNDDAALYEDTSGALRPVPASTVESGACDGLPAGTSCRPRPTCASASATPACPGGETAYCVRGAVREVSPPVSIPDSGAPPPDAGGPAPDAGGADAGDAGSTP